MRQRIDYIDLAKGICILSVILYHIFSPLNQTDANRILTCFRMPLYFFLSGLFFNKYAGFANFSLRKINKLLIPMFFFLFISYLFFSIIWLAERHFERIFSLPQNIFDGFNIERLYLNPPLWFLFSLFETSLIFYLLFVVCGKLIKKEKNRKAIMGIMCFLIGIIGFELGSYKMNLPLWIDTSMTALPFYYIGYFLRVETDFLLPNKFDKYIPFLLVILGLIVYSLAENIFMIKNAYNGNIISFYVSALCGILFVLLLSKLITKVALVSYLGRYSIIVLGTHWIIITILNRFLFFITNVWLLTGVIFILVAFISIPVIKFFLKYFPKFVSQEDLIRVDPIVDITNNDRLLSEQNESVEKK